MSKARGHMHICIDPMNFCPFAVFTGSTASQKNSFLGNSTFGVIGPLWGLLKQYAL